MTTRTVLVDIDSQGKLAFYALPELGGPDAPSTDVASVVNAVTSAVHDVEQRQRSPSEPLAVPRTVSVRTYWWGFQVEIPHHDLEDIAAAVDPIARVIQIIGPIAGAVAPFVMLIASFVVDTLQSLRATDRGRGVYVKMMWFAPGVFTVSPI